MAWVQPRPRLLPWRHWSRAGHQLEFPGYPFWLSKRLRRTLKAQVGCETLLASGVQAGTDCQPSRGCSALSDSESARLGSGAVLPLFTCILDHDLFGCSCKLELTVEPPASTGGRQVGLERKPRSARASWVKAKLGPKDNLEIFQGWSTALIGWQTSINMTEDHVSSLLCCYSVYFTTIEHNSISQSDQSSWKTFCESLYLKQIEIWFQSCCCGNQPMNLEELQWFINY